MLTHLSLHYSAEAVVIFEYEAQQEDELNLKVGDVIKEVQTVRGLTLFV